MKTHSSNANVQEYGCGALWKMALNNGSNKVMICDVGGKAIFESAMRNYSSSAGVQDKGTGALCILNQHCT